MAKANENYAIEAAVELAKANLKNLDQWINAEQIIEFINKIYDDLYVCEDNT